MAAPNLDILSETITDSRAAPSATPQMRTLFGELEKAASQSASIIAASLRTPAAAAQRPRKKKPEPQSINLRWPCFAVALLIGIAVMGLQMLGRDSAILSAFHLPALKYWYGYVPRDIVRYMVTLTGPQLILVTGPFVYPVAAIGISFCIAWTAGVGKKRIDPSLRLAGFAWDRNSFCRGWLITGATGSGKTTSAIVGTFHQVFRHEKGTLRDSWEGSDLEVKVEEIGQHYRQETERIHSKISILREERRKLDEELEAAMQQSLMGDIHYQTMSAEERAALAESIKSELKGSFLDPAATSIAAVRYQELLNLTT